jgi:hypothetical protein
MTRPIVALVHHRTALPWIFEAADRVGCDLLLIPRPGDVVEPAEVPYPVADVLHADVLTDPAGAVDTLTRYRQDHRLDGILTMYDPAVPMVAAAAARLGLAGLSPAAARRATDKRAVRDRLAAAGANTPAYVVVPEAGDADPLARLRYPVVVKPAAGYSSLGVVRVDAPESLDAELRRVAELCRRQLSPEAVSCGLLVEEYIDGTEYAVESFVWQGRTYVHSVGYKGQPVGPYFEEGVYRAPAVLAPPVRARITEQVTIANEALGIDLGPVHTELRVHPDGTPFVFDIGARIGGSGVSHFVVEHSTGIDFAGNALRVALGRSPVGLVDQPATVAHAGNYIVPTGGTGTIADISGLAEVAGISSVWHVAQFMYPGDEVRPYPEFSGYPAFVLSVHETADDLTEFHDYLGNAVVVRYDSGSSPAAASMGVVPAARRRR